MKWYAHLTGIILVLAAVSKFFPLTVGFILFSLIGSILPDLLEPWLGLRHRSKYVHNLAAAFPLILLGIFFSDWIMALGLAYIHHILLDSTTVTGIYVLDRRVKGSFKTSNLMHNIVIVLAHVLILLFVVR